MGCGSSTSSKSQNQLLLEAATNGDVAAARAALDAGAGLECMNTMVGKAMGGGQFSIVVSAQRAAPAPHT